MRCAWRQVHGAVAQGVGAALYEEVVYDEGGQVLTASLADYVIPAASEIPPIDIVHLETELPATMGGFRGMGEGGTIGAPAAVAFSSSVNQRTGTSVGRWSRNVSTTPSRPQDQRGCTSTAAARRRGAAGARGAPQGTRAASAARRPPKSRASLAATRSRSAARAAPRACAGTDRRFGTSPPNLGTLDLDHIDVDAAELEHVEGRPRRVEPAVDSRAARNVAVSAAPVVVCSSRVRVSPLSEKMGDGAVRRARAVRGTACRSSRLICSRL